MQIRNQVVGASPTGYEAWIDPCIEGSKMPPVLRGQGKEVTISEMPGLRQVWKAVPVGQRESVGSELMAGQQRQDFKDGSGIRGVAGKVRIAGMPENANHPVLGDRAGGPGIAARGSELCAASVMVHVVGIAQRDQDVYIEQVHLAIRSPVLPSSRTPAHWSPQWCHLSSRSAVRRHPR